MATGAGSGAALRDIRSRQGRCGCRARLVQQRSCHKGMESQELSVREGASTRHSIRQSLRSFIRCPEVFAEGAGLLTAAWSAARGGPRQAVVFTAACCVDFITDREARSGRAVMRAAITIGVRAVARGVHVRISRHGTSAADTRLAWAVAARPSPAVDCAGARMSSCVGARLWLSAETARTNGGWECG